MVDFIIEREDYYICCVSIIQAIVAVDFLFFSDMSHYTLRQLKEAAFTNYLRECLLYGIDETRLKIRHHNFGFEFVIAFF